MPPSRPSAVAGSGAALVSATLVGAVVVVARTLPPADGGSAAPAWIPMLLTWAFTASVTAAALIWIVIALRDGSAGAALTAGAMAALAGAAMMVLIGSGHPALPVFGAAGFQLAAAVADRLRPPLVEGSRRILVVAGALALAELSVAVAVLVGVGDTLLLWAAGASAAAGVLAFGRASSAEAFVMAAGAGALAVARDGGIEGLIGVACLATSALLTAVRGLEGTGGAAAPTLEADERLPDLAARLADAVLRFDGRLRLADWNATAATLLDLDETSRGSRMEELLGIPISGLPADDRIDTVERGVGGLDVTVHRAGGGVIAIIRDPGRAPESERLSRELRGTTEELTQARRTIELQRAEIERTSTIDTLTALPSRQAILDRLRTELAEAARYRHPVAIVLLDIDDFTQLNRLRGTAIGDAVLAEVALRLRLRVRTADALGRLGSDRFLAILPHTDEAGATTFADALRRRLATRELGVGSVSLAITVSAGVAIMQAGEDLGLDALLARAEEALARATRAGGDRVVLERPHPHDRFGRPGASDRPSADSVDEGPA
jgi:diguanylate cyclase (GGDEF)-like protein